MQEDRMFTYITLYRYTAQGIRSIKESPKRIDLAKQAMEKAGAKLKGIYLTAGRYDLVAISEWPSEEAAMTFLLAQAAAGNVTTETLRAFDEAAFKKMAAAVP
jgi:uncharacterized protein with GYD domain